jgi:carbonic anhydrase/acetyltransferase-like protein (isoleucine patch superfamily)
MPLSSLTRARHIALVFLLCAARDVVLAQRPVGDEIEVNASARSNGFRPDVAMDARGRFTAVWLSDETSPPTVRARRFDSSGRAFDEPFAVYFPADEAEVASDAAGGFVVAWTHRFALSAHRFDSSGLPVGTSFRVSSEAVYGSSLAMAPGGEFVLAWATDYGSDVDLVRVANDGKPVGRVNLGEGMVPQVAMHNGGDFVVAWVRYDRDRKRNQVVGQLFRGGRRLGGVFEADGEYPFHHSPSAVAMARDGSFVIAWVTLVDGSEGVAARILDRDGRRVAGELLVRGGSLCSIRDVSVASDTGEGFTVVWSEGFGDAADVHAQHISTLGVPTGPELRVNSVTTGFQGQPAAAGNGRGGLIVAWRSQFANGSRSQILARRFRSSDAETDAGGDSDGDSVPDVVDNCPTIANADQVDVAGDGFGDACVSPDADIAPTAWLGGNPVVGQGTVVAEGVVLGADATLGAFVVLGSQVEAGDRLIAHDFVVVGSRSRLGNDVTLGERSRIGTGAALGNRVHIGDGATVGRNVAIGDGAAIGPLAIVSAGARIGTGAVVEMGARVGRRAIVSPGAVVPAGASVPPGATFP